MHKKVTEDTLRDLDSMGIPRIYVYNKADLRDRDHTVINRPGSEAVYISARTGYGIDELLDAMSAVFRAGSRQIDVLIPYSAGDLLDRVHREGEIIHESYESRGIKISAICPAPLAHSLEKAVAGCR